ARRRRRSTRRTRRALRPRGAGRAAVDAAPAPAPARAARRGVRPRGWDRDWGDPLPPRALARLRDGVGGKAGAAAPPRARPAAARGGRRRVRIARSGARRHRDEARRPLPRAIRGGGRMSAIELRDVFRVHSTPEGDAAALQGLSLAVQEREVVTVLGPSGAGKSTLLRILAALDRPSAGIVRVFGTEIGKLPAHRAAAYRASTLGYADQHYSR